MAREYLPGYYLPHHDPAPHHSYHHYAHQQTSNASGGAGAYEMTASGGANVHAPSHLAHDSHKQHNVAYGCGDGYEVAACDTPATAPPAPAQTAPAQTAPASNTRKRKASSYGTSSAYDEEVGGDDSSQSSQNASEKKQNHSEIEKRRRDKMNTYICELSNMIPMCGAMARKLDKLSVLRMAVAHLRSVRGALSACPLAARPLPAFLPRREVAARVLAAARPACLLVVGCDRGRLLYVSATINRMLHYHQSELLGQSLFDILHPKDVAKVKEQLSSPDLSPRERLVDAKTMLPVKPDVVSASCLCLGARRSFFCRIKCKSTPDDPAVKEDPEPAAKIRKKHSEKKYCVVHCTGYLKSWAPSELGESGGTSGTEEGELSSLSCLVAVGRALPDLVPAPTPPSTAPSSAPAPPSTAPARRVQYVSRHSPDGKFLFVDQRVTLALGFLPQELLGTSLYEYMAGPELAAVARTHKASLMRREPLHTTPYCFRKKDGTYAKITTHFKPFKNPWTKEVECLVANNTVVEQYAVPTPNPSPPYAFPPIYKTAEAGGEWARFPGEGEEMRRRIAAQVESHKIGAAIVQEALRGGGAASPDLPTDLLLDPAFPHQVSLVDSMFGSEACYGPTRASPPPMSSPVSPPLPPLDGNGEAAMAVIMSLLEADAGLGGPINFSGLPWPLP